MEKTKTVNVVSTPNIEGNIGSCSVSSSEIKSSDSIFTADYHVVQVNSCTGHIIAQYDYTSYFGVWASLAVGAVVLFLGLMIWADSH